MQLRALIKTRKRKWAMIVLGVAVCAAAVWLLLDAVHKPMEGTKREVNAKTQRREDAKKNLSSLRLCAFASLR